MGLTFGVWFGLGMGLLGAPDLRVERKENGTMLPQMAMLHEHDPEPLFGVLSFYARRHVR